MALYKNDETGIVQFHPKSGIGPALGSTEVDEDSKPVVPLGADKTETNRRVRLATKPGGKKTATKTTGKPAGDNNTEGAN